jgi:diguanylate cyclase (GGDEF)-like protein
MVMVDVDGFKSLSDSYGHSPSDIVFRKVADLLRGRTRNHDVVARFGSEEFVILLPTTGVDESIIVAECLRCTVHNE